MSIGPNLAAFLWPYVGPQVNSYLGVGFYVELPTGEYHKEEAVNLGSNRFTLNPQVLFQKNITNKLSVELAGDMIFYTDNRNAGIAGEQNLSQEPTVGLQTFLNYAITTTIGVTAAYEGERGGTQKLNGMTNGDSTDFDEVRLIGGWFITPEIQLLADFDHRFDVSGGFRQDFGATGRLVFLF